MTPHANGERNGSQWQNVGPVLAGFAASVVVAYIADQGSGWPRVESACGTAAMLLLVTMGIARYAMRLLSIHPMNSVNVFIGVWGAVIFMWLIAFRG